MVAGTLVATCWAASGAWAHVTVTAPGATRGGGDQEITFRVPVEKDATTVGLKVLLPTDTPIASVDVAPIAGWSHKETSIRLAKPIVTDDGNITEAVSEIDWTADPGHGLKPGEFGAFTIIAGQLPDTGALTFKAIQLYSDGSEVDWTQVDAPGSTAELDDPAPVLTLPSGGPTEAAAAVTPQAASTPAKAVATAKTSSAAGIVLGIIALVVSLIALGLVLVPRLRRAGA
jgi:uncharacterized protein